MGDGKKEPTLEENFARLEEIILQLEKAFQTYSEGMLLLERCNSQIDRVEKQVLKLSADGQLEEFAYGDEGV